MTSLKRSFSITQSPSKRALLITLLPFVIAAIAFGLRLYSLDWDQGNLYHPDERSIFMRVDCMYKTLVDDPGWLACANREFPLDQPGLPSASTFFSAETSPLNPHWFPLGSILLYLLLIIRLPIDLLTDHVTLQDLAAAGRLVTVLIDTASVLLLYALGKRLYGRRVGLLASAFGAFSFISIQLSHFYRPEPFIILFTLSSFWFMLNVVNRRRWRDHLILGALIGLIFATRATSLHLLLPLSITYGLLMFNTWCENRETVPIVSILGVAVRGALAGMVALTCFAFWMPYAFIDIHKFLSDLFWEAGVAREAGLVPYTMQYIGTSSGIYELRQTSVWALGLPLGLVAWTGLIMAVWRNIQAPRLGEVLILSWVLPVFLTLIFFEVKFLRYIAPILPCLILFGSYWLISIYDWAAFRSRILSKFICVLIAFVFVATAFYGIAFSFSHNAPHPAVQASEWIRATVSPGSKILTDNHWDEGFPKLHAFSVTQLPMYESDKLSKMLHLSEQLSSADYIISYSNRPWGSIARLPGRYPWSSNYYQELFNGGLGYQLDRAFARYPSLMGVSFSHDPFTRAGVYKPSSLPGLTSGLLTLDLGYADENITNYDHPLVLVFRNTERLSASNLFDRIVSGKPSNAPERLLLSEKTLALHRESGTWTAIFPQSFWANQVPLLAWLLIIYATTLAILPIMIVSMRWLPDRGFVLAKPAGLLLVSYLTWLGASLGWWHFSRASVLGILGLLLLISVLTCYLQRHLLLSFVRKHWKYILLVEILFLAAFLAFVFIRAANPDLWHPWRGGEKPMELSYLTALIKSPTMPPYDPWYAGGYLNYYYFGLFIVALLTKTTGIVPTVAYNLAIPLFFAMTLIVSFSIGFNATEALRQRRYPDLSFRGSLVAGAVAALLMVILANLDGMIQLLEQTWASFTGHGFGTFDFWRSSRMMPSQINITEFPYWTFLFGDLHAHLIAIPFSLFALGLSLNIALSGSGERALSVRFASLLLLALAIGGLSVINTWNVPTYGIISVAAGAIMLFTWPGSLRKHRLGIWLGWSAALFGAAYVLFLPYHLASISSFEGLQLSQWRTPIWQYLGIHGLLFFLVVSWISVELIRRMLRRPLVANLAPQLLNYKIFSFHPRLFWIILATVVGCLLLWLVGWETVAILTVLGLMATILVVWWMANRTLPDAPVHLFLLICAILAFSIGIGVDVITVKPDIDRMNTVFKLYLDGWALLSFVASVGLWHLFASRAIEPWSVNRWMGRTWRVIFGLLLLSSAIFPVLGTRERLQDRFDVDGVPLTLEGSSFLQTALYHDPGPSNTGNEPSSRYYLSHDAAALDYMRHNIQGSPVVLEAVTTQYRWTPRVAVYTGLPVVIGWEFHQTQQRADYRGEIQQRVRDVNSIFRTIDPAPALRLLHKYDVSFVYIGPTERLYYPAEGLKKFEALLSGNLSIFYKNDAVTVYRVLPIRAH